MGGVRSLMPLGSPCHTVTRDPHPLCPVCKRDGGWRMAWKDGGPAFSHPSSLEEGPEGREQRGERLSLVLREDFQRKEGF